MVVDKPGTYLTGALRLTGCIHLELPAGVTLLAGAQVGRVPGWGTPRAARQRRRLISLTGA